MSRGGRGGGRGGARKGPDLSWDDEESTAPAANRPEPLFPSINLVTPKPITKHELGQVQAYLSFRERIRNGPLYSVIDPSGYTDESTGRVNKRKGFDSFNDQVRYSSKHFKKRRTMPDLAAWKDEYRLNWFPKELWSTVDPQQKHPLWKTLEPNDPAFGPSRKRKQTAIQPDAEEEAPENASENDSDTSSVVAMGRRRTTKARTRKDDPTTKPVTQKRGLDAEDDYGDVEQNVGDEDEAEEGEEELEDTEFEESDDGGGDDYNGENYFDDGEKDDDGGGGGDDEGGYF